jgi:phosphatidylethanolamine/phosphatidyl-N-methylethanolamine N-methyltransferase
MKRLLSEYRLFLREFWSNYHTTGAILPSGPWLAAALARYVGKGDRAQRILEVGPGTGAVTRRIARAMRPVDRLDLVELNGSFVERLRESFQGDPVLRPVADRARVLHCAVQELAGEPAYDVIISGLPLNNFSPGLVEQILGTMTGLLRRHGTLSFFQYIYIRRIKSAVVGRRAREHLDAVGRVMDALLAAHEFRRDWVWPNVPPAWVHHVRLETAPL